MSHAQTLASLAALAPTPSIPRVTRAADVGASLGSLGPPAKVGQLVPTGWELLRVASAVATGYHGYEQSRRSLGWAAAWAAFGYLIPIVAVPVALYQGYAKPGPVGR